MDKIYNEILSKINDNTLHLATLPDLIIKVNAALADDNKNLTDIAKIIQREVSLSTRIIRIANSPGLRGSKEVDSIIDAINRLGITLVKNLAIIVSLNDKFATTNSEHDSLMRRITKNSIDSGAYGFMIAKYLVPSLSPDLALLIGLISKVGHMVVLRYLNDTVEHRLLNEDDTCKIVTEISSKVCEMLMSKWGFPQSCITALSDNTPSNLDDPRTYRDVYIITQKYIDHKNHPTSESHLEIFDIIDDLLGKNKEEFLDLRSIIS